MEQMEQLIGHALSRVDDAAKLHDRHEVETKSSMNEWKAEVVTASQAIQAEARAAAQIIQDLRSQVTAVVTALQIDARG
jgi:predicted  nucleic acid-binding Zn-ribbon protein